MTRPQPPLRLLLAVLPLLLLLASSAPLRAQRDNTWHKPRAYTPEHPLIYEDAWDLWPYVFLDDEGKPTGFNVDLLTTIFGELGIPFEIRLKPTMQALEDLREGRSDLMLGMMDPFHDDYTLHYGKSIVHLFTHSVVHPADNALIVSDIDDLATQQVIVHSGSFSHHLMEERGWQLNAQPFDDMQLAIQMISAENRGQMLWNTMSLKWLMRKYHATNLRLSPVDMPSGEYHFMANDSTLLSRLDQAYARLKEKDRLQPLEMQWFYPEEMAERSAPAWLWDVVNALVVIVVLLIAATAVYHIRERRATAHMRRRISRLSVALKTSGVSVWTYNAEKKAITWYGDDVRSQTTMTLKNFARRYWPAELDQLRDAMGQLLGGERSEASLQMHITDIEASENHIYRVALAVLSTDDGGKPTVVVGTECDATDDIGNKRKTDGVMQRYRAVFTTAMIDMVYCDSQGYVANMNARAQHTFGVTLEEARQRRLNIRDFHPHDLLSYHYTTHALTAEGAPLPEGSHPDNTSRFYEMQTLPVFDSEGKTLGIYATGREVTEVVHTYVKTTKGLKQLRAAMDELGEYVSNINYVLQVGGVRIVTYSPDSHVLNIFHRMHELQYVLTQQRCLALTAPEATGQVMRAMRAMDRRTKANVTADIATRLRTPDGRQVCLQVQLFPQLDAEGRVTMYEGVSRDVSQMKHTEQMLMLETEKAQEVEQLKNKFLHNMCSAIRTPLDVVVQSAEMFEKEHDPAQEPEYIETIKTHTAYLLNLVNDILFLSRLDAHMVETVKREVDIATTLEALCSNGWREGRREGVAYEVQNVYEHLVVSIDVTNLERILDQLLRNAVAHTAQGRVRVRYEYIGGKLVVGVEDTGEGMSKKELSQIFERFSTPSGKASSTGLGLPICKELATLMDGFIDINSEQGKGTTVWVTIPCEAKLATRRNVE